MNPQPTFFAALKEVLRNGVAAVGLNLEELFYIANNLCPQKERLRYGTYMQFIDTLDKYGEPTVLHEQGDLLLEIRNYIKARQANKRLAMLNHISQGQKDWRRFVWLLQLQEKQERQKNMEARQQAKEQKEREKAAAEAAKLNASAQTEPAKTIEPKAATAKDTAAQPTPAATQPQPYKASNYERQQQMGKTG